MRGHDSWSVARAADYFTLLRLVGVAGCVVGDAAVRLAGEMPVSQNGQEAVSVEASVGRALAVTSIAPVPITRARAREAMEEEHMRLR